MITVNEALERALVEGVVESFFGTRIEGYDTEGRPYYGRGKLAGLVERLAAEMDTTELAALILQRVTENPDPLVEAAIDRVKDAFKVRGGFGGGRVEQQRAWDKAIERSVAQVLSESAEFREWITQRALGTVSGDVEFTITVKMDPVGDGYKAR